MTTQKESLGFERYLWTAGRAGLSGSVVAELSIKVGRWFETSKPVVVFEADIGIDLTDVSLRLSLQSGSENLSVNGVTLLCP